MPIPTEVLLIDDVYIKSQTEVNDSVQSSLIYPVIVTVQDTYLESILGTRLFNKIKTDYGAGTITGIYATLHDMYIRKCLLWAVMVQLYPKLVYKVDNTSLVQRTSEDTTTVDDQRMKDTMSRAINSRDIYESKLINYLCANSSLIPEYTSCEFPDVYPKRIKTITGLSISDGNTAMSRQSNGWTHREEIRRFLP